MAFGLGKKKDKKEVDKDLEDVKEQVLSTKDPKKLVEKVEESKKELDQDAKPTQKVDAVDESNPFVKELKEEFDAGRLSKSAYEEAISAYSKKSKPKEESKEQDSSKKKEDVQDSKKEEKASEDKSEEDKGDVKEGSKKESKEDEKEGKAEDKGSDEKKDPYEGLGSLNVLKVYLKQKMDELKKKKNYWNRGGNFQYPFNNILGELNQILSEKGLLAIDLDLLTKELEKLGFIDGVSIQNGPFKQDPEGSEELTKLAEFTPQVVEKLNDEEVLEEIDKENVPELKSKESKEDKKVLQEEALVATSPTVSSVAAPIMGGVDIETVKRVEEIRTRLELTDGKFLPITERLENLTDRVGEIRGQGFDREKTIGEIAIRVDSIDSAVKELDPRSIAKKNRELLERIDGLEEDNKKLVGDLSSLIKEFSDVKRTFEKLKDIKAIMDLGHDVGKSLIVVEDEKKNIERMSNKVEDMYIQIEKKFSDLPVFIGMVERIDGLSLELLQAVDGLKTKQQTYLTRSDLADYKKEVIAQIHTVEDSIDQVRERELNNVDKKNFVLALKELNIFNEKIGKAVELIKEHYDDSLLSESSYKELKKANSEKLRKINNLIERIEIVVDFGKAEKSMINGIYLDVKKMIGKDLAPKNNYKSSNTEQEDSAIPVQSDETKESEVKEESEDIVSQKEEQENSSPQEEQKVESVKQESSKSDENVESEVKQEVVKEKKGDEKEDLKALEDSDKKGSEEVFEEKEDKQEEKKQDVKVDSQKGTKEVKSSDGKKTEKKSKNSEDLKNNIKNLQKEINELNAKLKNKEISLDAYNNSKKEKERRIEGLKKK